MTNLKQSRDEIGIDNLNSGGSRRTGSPMVWYPLALLRCRYSSWIRFSLTSKFLLPHFWFVGVAVSFHVTRVKLAKQVDMNPLSPIDDQEGILPLQHKIPLIVERDLISHHFIYVCTRLGDRVSGVRIQLIPHIWRKLSSGTTKVHLCLECGVYRFGNDRLLSSRISTYFTVQLFLFCYEYEYTTALPENRNSSNARLFWEPGFNEKTIAPIPKQQTNRKWNFKPKRQKRCWNEDRYPLQQIES